MFHRIQCHWKHFKKARRVQKKMINFWVMINSNLHFLVPLRHSVFSMNVCDVFQVEIWWRGTGENVQSQRKIFQYKVYDKSVSFFAPGTSSAVL